MFTNQIVAILKTMKSSSLYGLVLLIYFNVISELSLQLQQSQRAIKHNLGNSLTNLNQGVILGKENDYAMPLTSANG